MPELFHDLEEVEKRLKVSFKNKKLLQLALVHRSFWNENQGLVKGHNERLEFLGDSVLGMTIAEYLYVHFPDFPEGTLSDLRSRLVEAVSCASYVHKLALGHYPLLGKGEKMNMGKGRETILADFFEALIGALYLDQGYEAVKSFFLSHFQPEIDAILASPARNWKAELQDFTQKKYQKVPFYEVIEEGGPAHDKFFRIAAIVNDEKVGIGVGSSKKEAQQKAAEAALEVLLRGDQSGC